MAVNKVVFGEDTLIDISDSTLSPSDLLEGKVAYNAAGEKIVGTLSLKTVNGKSLIGPGNLNVGVDFEVGVEKWYGTYKEAGVTYQVYCKVVYIPALPAEAGITNYPHGITGIKQILAIYGTCSNSFVMNAPRQNNQDNIAIYQAQKSGNFAIEVGKDRSSVAAYVTLIYAKNN